MTGKLDLTPVAVKAGRQLSERPFNNKADAKLDYTDVATVSLAIQLLVLLA